MANYTVRFADGRTYGPAEISLLQQWAREGRLSPDATLIPGDGSPECRVSAHESLRPHVMAPPTVFTGMPAAPPDSAASTIIPFRNPAALAGYYIAVASLIPITALVCGPLAVGLGIAGFRRSRRERQAKGAVHAWVAIVVGSLTTVANVGLIVVLVLAS